MKPRSIYMDSFNRKQKTKPLASIVAKESRVVKAVKKSTEMVVVLGKRSSLRKKKFQFSVTTPQQQMKKRNSAYQFFRID